MLDANHLLLYVADARQSCRFYAELLTLQPVEAQDTFCMFRLPSGVMLGLWGAAGVQPAATPPGGFELGFAVASRDEVDGLHRQWQACGIRMLQPPTAMDFGYTFTACDPDGHRLRVYAPEGA
ncbi:VOC family protein [uncultured Aquincola sp.]|uniref:VOC family protein n=1 Tax=uncultured Aquincola sp. TaxID=886556 RepID=UPI0032B24FAA